MDKLTIATQVLLKLIETDKTGFDAEGIAGYAWEIADAMQAEAEKRISKERPKVLFEPKCEVDWRVAPKDATHYVIFADGLAYWFKSEKLECFDIAPSFGIVGMCVVERPHGF